VIVRIHSRQAVHVVVTVRFKSQWLVLDNHSMIIAESTEIHGYVPSLVLDHRGVREFLPPFMSQTLASLLPCGKALG
jgi:hypothetical protein